MNWTQIKTCLFFMALFFCNYVICEEDYAIDILSMTTEKDSYEILGSIHNGEKVEWVALHSKMKNYFNDEQIDQHDVFLYNVNNRSLIKLGLYKDADIFDIHKKSGESLQVIFYDQYSKGSYKFDIINLLPSKTVTFDKIYRIFDKDGKILEQNGECVKGNEVNIEIEKFNENQKLIGYLNENEEEYLLLKNQTNIFYCPIKDGKAKCEDPIVFFDYILRKGHIIIKSDTDYVFIPDGKKCILEEGNQVILDAIYYENGTSSCSTCKKVQNPFRKSHYINSSRGLTEEHFGIFSSEHGSVVAHVKGHFYTPPPTPTPEPTPEPIPEPTPEPTPSELSPSEPVTSPSEPVTPTTDKVTTPQGTERSATTWAIVVIVLIVLSGLAYIAWRYFRGNQPISNPFANENNI